MCRKNGGVDSQVVVSLVVLKLVLGLPAAFLGFLIGFFVCFALQGSFADGPFVNEGPGNWIVLSMMMIGFFLPSFIGPLVRSVFLCSYSHVACYPSRRVEKCSRLLAWTYVFYSCLCLLYLLREGMA